MTPEQHARIKQLFLEVRGLPPDQRPAFLDRACAGRDDLRREVAALLAQHVSVPEASGGTESADAPEMGGQGAHSEHYESGHVIADRYRIISALGSGGMGDVYRAEDLKLNQEVALKFLPAERAADPAWKARLVREVRVAREVTHPNVCRIHDIGEADGVAFISMEYVDGEDLKSLIHRIGRIQGDKAVDIARQLCAGLAAAHVRRVLHRDLKPANVMIDGRGRVRITDFGLAALKDRIEQREIRAGTPRYMAPEQLAGLAVSEKSDLYSLGLILYEMFTGRPAFTAEGAADYLELHQRTDPSWPSSLVADIDPEVERIILACLHKDPAQRPESALAVAAALPGGDVLAMALGIGETPSPELVAAAGLSLRLNRPLAVSCLVGYLALVAGSAMLGSQSADFLVGSAESPPQVLVAKAREVLSLAGLREGGADTAWGYLPDPRDPGGFFSVEPPAAAALELAGERPLFWYRQSPTELLPNEAANVLFGGAQATFFDPAQVRAGMVRLVLDRTGRLNFLDAIPPGGFAPREGSIDWPGLLRQSGVSDDTPAAEAARGLPLSGDRRLAWTCADPGRPERRLHVEARALDGIPLSLKITPAEPIPPEGGMSRWQLVRGLRLIILCVFTLISLPIARHNFRAGRVDRRGAARLAAVIIILRMLYWLFVAHHVADVRAELALVIYALLGAFGEAALVCLFYAALEPLVRRFWPQAMVSWSRLVAGRLRDPVVGSNWLVGGLVGACWAIVLRLDARLPEWLGLEGAEQLRARDLFSHLVSLRAGLAMCFDLFREDIYFGVLILLIVTFFRAAVRRPSLAIALSIVVISAMYVPAGSHPLLSLLTIGGGCVALAIWLLTRLGLLAIIAALFTCRVLLFFPLSVGRSHWSLDVAVLGPVVATGLVIFAFMNAAERRASIPR